MSPSFPAWQLGSFSRSPSNNDTSVHSVLSLSHRIICLKVSEIMSDTHSVVTDSLRPHVRLQWQDCSLPGSSVHGILQARIREWFAIFFSSLKLNLNDISLSSSWINHWATQIISHEWRIDYMAILAFGWDRKIYFLTGTKDTINYKKQLWLPLSSM